MMNSVELYAWEQMVNAMARLNPNQRVELLSKLASSYCFHCGYPQPPEGKHCQCRNDE